MSRDRKFDLEAGTTELYRDPVYYDYEYKSRAGDIRWYTDLYRDCSDWVLELGVGSGRIAARAAREGARVLGLDLSTTMLERAQARKHGLPRNRREALQLVLGDMRAFAFRRRFGLVSCPFNAFQHLYTREDVERCLACVRDALLPDGMFAFDVLMPDLEYLGRSPFKRFPGMRFKHPTHGIHFTYAEQTAFDSVTQLNQMWLHYDRSDPGEEGPPSYSVQLSHRYFFPAELEALLHYNGFRLLCRYGDFEQGELQSDSESMVVVAGLRQE